MYKYMCVYMHVCVCVCVYIHIYINIYIYMRERPVGACLYEAGSMIKPDLDLNKV